MEQENALAETAQAAPDAAETASVAEARQDGETKPETEQAKAPRVFTQEELDAEIGKRLARQERKAARERDRAIAEAVARAQPKLDPQAPEKPNPEAFKSTEDYLEALTDWKVDQRVKAEREASAKAQREHSTRQATEEVVNAHRDREDVAREKYDDFDTVVYNPQLSITTAMAETIQESDNGPELAYFLGKNPKEAARIAALSPFLQAKELGRLESKLTAAPPATKTSSAPEPINPVKGKTESQPVYDTTDPRSLKALGTSAWIEADRKRQEAKLRAKGYT
jgi:hypothetical protein